MTDRFDERLERELDGVLHGIASRPANPRASRYSQVVAEDATRRSPTMLMRKLLTTTGAKVAVAGALVASAAGAAAAGAAHSHSSSTNPSVTQPGGITPAQVQACRSAAATSSDRDAMGDCVSKIASAHGQYERDRHAHQHGAPGSVEENHESGTAEQHENTAAPQHTSPPQSTQEGRSDSSPNPQPTRVEGRSDSHPTAAPPSHPH